MVSAITRSGTNQFHGELGSYYTDNIRFRGDQRQSLRLNPLKSTEIQYTTGARDPGHTVEPLMTIGGPIMTNRVWFFGGYNPQLSKNERTVTFTQNRAAGPQTFTNSSEDHNITYNVTAQITNNLRTKFAGSNEPTKGSIGLPGLEPDYISSEAGVLGDRVADSAYRTSTANPASYPGVLYNTGFTNSYRSVTDWVATPKLYFNVTAGWLGYGTRGKTLTEFNTDTRRTFSQSPNVFPEVPASLIQPSGYADGIVNTQTVKDDYTRVSASADMTYYAAWKGQHTLKGGFQYERLGNEVNTGQQAPNIALNWNTSYTTIDLPPRILRGTYGYFEVRRAYTEGKIHANNYGVFVQDAWTVNNKLTLNLGLRTEQEDIPSYRPENPGLDFSFSRKLAPRVGFAFDVKGDGRWKTYGSWGMFYDISKLEMPRGAFGRRPLDRLLLHARHLQLALDQLRRQERREQRARRDVHRAGGLPPRLERCGRRHTDRPEPQADPRAGVHARPRSRAESDDVGRRAVLAQVARPHNRGRRHPASPGVGEVFYDREPGLGHRREHAARQGGLSHLPEPAAPQTRLRRRRVPADQAPGEPLVHEHQLPVEPALRQLLGTGQLG